MTCQSYRSRPVVLGNERDHLYLVHRMARSNGTDLVKAFATGDLTQEDWAKMVIRCQGCQWTEGCQRWLSRHQEPGSAETPAQCENQSEFTALSSSAA